MERSGMNAWTSIGLGRKKKLDQELINGEIITTISDLKAQSLIYHRLNLLKKKYNLWKPHRTSST